MVGWLYHDGGAHDVRLVVLDKDGTLLDFNATWLPAFQECARRVAVEAGEKDLAPALLKVGGWLDEEDGPRIAQDGLLLHGTNEQCAQCWIDTQPIVAAHFERDVAALTRLMEEVLQECTVRDVKPLGPVEDVLRELRAAGLTLAVVTNDTEAIARAQLAQLGWTDYFQSIIGADSGYGGKPKGGGIRAAVQAAGVEPEHAIMVGDAEGDMVAGHAAGCAFTVAIWPDGVPLHVGLASAACRMPTIAALPEALAVTGHRQLRQAREAFELPPSSTSGTPQDGADLLEQGHEQAARAAEAAAAAADPDLIALVQGMVDPPPESAQF